MLYSRINRLIPRSVPTDHLFPQYLPLPERELTPQQLLPDAQAFFQAKQVTGNNHAHPTETGLQPASLELWAGGQPPTGQWDPVKGTPGR